MAEVLRAEDILKKHDNPSNVENVKTPRKKVKKQKKKNKNEDNSSESEDDANFVQMRGRIVSGRKWKSQKKRASSIINSPGLRLSFERKQKLREELKRVKELSRLIEQDRLQAKLDKKRRREENLKRAEENQKKNEIVQVIKSSAKIKRMRKTQLRHIEKRDVTDVK
ncbi:hypothetical protein R5R35_014137 [Gryllus longicercus]|uniref:Coiled-coil domain-containing protein 86 n=2 Tax=Gryllus longicercus TaxID=2509291 RepID=A0AAN9Z0T2_9ORTH